MECFLQTKMVLKIGLFMFAYVKIEKKTRVLTMLLIGNQKEYTILNLEHYMVSFYLT